MPRAAGICPVNWLPWMTSPSSLENWLTCGGISPVNWLKGRNSPVTRPLASVVTPNHSRSGRVLSQLSFLGQFAPPKALLNCSSKARSAAESTGAQLLPKEKSIPSSHA